MTQKVKQSTLPQRSRQAGLSLVELMIALVLGLLVVSALFNVYVGTSRSSSFSDGLRAMQENGRHGISTLRQGIRLAGYSPDIAIDLEPFDIAASSTSSLVVRMVAQRDCNGELTGADGIAENTYALNSKNEITCEGNSASASEMPLIEGVDEFSVLYGVDTDGDLYADSYVSYDSNVDPYSVKAIRFAILVNSINAIRTRSVSETHVVLDKEFSSNDRIARHVFTSTVLLRNGVEPLI